MDLFNYLGRYESNAVASFEDGHDLQCANPRLGSVLPQEALTTPIP